jgi:hypothetical protein
MTNVFQSKDGRILLALLTLLGIVLVATTIRGAFIIDEINYMVTVTGLRQGTLMVPGTGKVTPSKELYFFDPESENRVATTTPVASLAPPLYAPIALPFSVGGWRGLAFLNTLSFLLSAVVVYLFVRRFATEHSTPWIAVSLFVLGGYELEYAQGVWPHMLSLFVCLVAVYIASRVWEGDPPRYAVWAGLLFGIACGIREQNVFLAVCLGLTFLVFGNRKILTAVFYAAGASVPLVISSTLNYFKLGIWFPTPKAIAYTGMVTGSTHPGSWFDPFKVFWVKIVDFSAFGFFQDPSVFVDYSREPSTGAYLVGGVVKKALVQSSPWVALAIIVALGAWVARYGSNEITRRNIRALSLLLVPTLVVFSLAGFRTDGLSFNQRYLLELVPIAAVLVALCLDGLSLSLVDIITGFLLAGVLFAAALIIPSRDVLNLATLRLPLLLAIVVILGWVYRTRTNFRRLLSIGLGLCIGWSLSMESIDLIAARSIRARNAVLLERLDEVIPDHSVLFAYWGRQKAAAGPLQLTKDVLILDPWADAGKDAPQLARSLARENNRVFIIGTGIPPEIMRSIEGRDSLAVVLTDPMLLYEFVEKHKDVSAITSSPCPSRSPELNKDQQQLPFNDTEP